MRTKHGSALKFGLWGLALCLQIGVVPVAVEAAAQAGRGGRGQAPVDPRVEQRTYLFEETNEDLPYAVFVSSKVREDAENPLIIALHGLGDPPCRCCAATRWIWPKKTATSWSDPWATTRAVGTAVRCSAAAADAAEWNPRKTSAS